MIVVDSVQREQIDSPLYSQCEKKRTERDAGELSRGVSRKLGEISANSARDSILRGKIGLKMSVE